MKNFVKFQLKEKGQIKVNKRQNSKYKELNYIKNDISTVLDDDQNDNYIRKITYLDDYNKNNSNAYLRQNSPEYKVSYPVSNTHRELNYHKINIIDKINKNENRYINNQTQYSTFLNNNCSNKKKKMEEDKGNKLLIYKSETQYPLTFRQSSKGMKGCNSMKNLNYEPNKNYNMRICSISPKYGINIRTENENNQKFILDRFTDNEYLNDNAIMQNYDDTFLKRNQYINIPIESTSSMSFSNYGQLYQPLRGQMNNNTNYYYNNNENFYVNNINNQNFIHYQNKTPKNGKNEYIQLLRKNKKIKIHYDLDDIKKDKELIKAYKIKLINIFDKFMTDFYYKYFKRNYEELISRLRKNKNSIINLNENNQNIQLNNNSQNDYENKKSNNQINNDIKTNFQNYNSNNIHCHKKFSSMSFYKKIDKSKYPNVENSNDKNYKKKTTKDNYDSKKKGLTKKSWSNLYIPAKKRNINDFTRNMKNSGSKGSIFNKIKIDKNSKIIEIDSSNIIFRNNSNKNSLHYNNYRRNVLFNSNNSDDQNRQKIQKLMLSRNLKERASNNILLEDVKQENNNNKKNESIFHKKIMPKEKKRDKNIFKKKTEKINHKNISKEKTNDDIFKINNNYNTSSSVFNNRDFKNKNKKNEEDLKTNNCYNNNSTNMSNNINDYYLNDKPRNMMY
jgi:hypothetical protein